MQISQNKHRIYGEHSSALRNSFINWLNQQNILKLQAQRDLY